MKPRLITPTLLLALSILLAPQSPAQMRYMDWLDGPDRDWNLTADCSNLAPTHELVVSFRTAESLEGVTRIDAFIDYCTDPADLFEWWRFDVPGSCREGGLSVAGDFPEGLDGVDAWEGVEHEINFSLTPELNDNPVLARINVSMEGDLGALEPDTTYNLFRVVFANPDQSCIGCDEPACLIINGLSLTHAEGVQYTSMNYGNFASYNWGNRGCPFIVPVQDATWGDIKALYGEGN